MALEKRGGREDTRRGDVMTGSYDIYESGKAISE